MADRQEQRWRGRPILAFAVRTAVVLAPVVLSTALVFAVAAALPPRVMPRWLEIVALLVLGFGCAISVERLARQLMPLAVLLRMTMLFPDRAPSRLRVARRSLRKTDVATLAAAEGASDLAERIITLLTALTAHDKKTRGHAERVQLLAEMVARQMGLSEGARDRLRWAALLHDIGKLTVAASVLNKPGKLDPREWDLIRQHPLEGARITGPLLAWLGEWGSAIAQHHERFDGTGYPLGLAGKDITVAGRLVAVVDAYETMTAARAYRKPMSTREAREELARCAGTHFDAAVVRAFLDISLPRLRWFTGPASTAAQLPVVSALQQAGSQAFTGAMAAGTGMIAGTAAVALVAGPAPVPVADAGAADHGASSVSAAGRTRAAIDTGGGDRVAGSGAGVGSTTRPTPGTAAARRGPATAAIRPAPTTAASQSAARPVTATAVGPAQPDPGAQPRPRPTSTSATQAPAPQPVPTSKPVPKPTPVPVPLPVPLPTQKPAPKPPWPLPWPLPTHHPRPTPTPTPTHKPHWPHGH